MLDDDSLVGIDVFVEVWVLARLDLTEELFRLGELLGSGKLERELDGFASDLQKRGGDFGELRHSGGNGLSERSADLFSAVPRRGIRIDMVDIPAAAVAEKGDDIPVERSAEGPFDEEREVRAPESSADSIEVEGV